MGGLSQRLVIVHGTSSQLQREKTPSDQGCVHVIVIIFIITILPWINNYESITKNLQKSKFYFEHSPPFWLQTKYQQRHQK